MTKRLIFKYVKKIFKKNNLILLDTVYKNAHIKMNYICNICNYKHMISLGSVKNGHGCPQCAGNIKYNIDDVKKIFKEHNVTLLDTVYINAHIKMNCVCNVCNYKWKKSLNKIKNGKRTGCPKCYGNLKLNIIIAKQIYKTNNLTLLENNYKNIMTKMLSQCNKCKYVWLIRLNDIKYGVGCPKCSQGKNEKFIIEIIEKLFNKKFIKDRKLFEGLECDGLNHELKLGIEVNGEQHYKWITRFHKKQKQFDKRIEYDKRKLVLAKQKGYNLIVVPYWIKQKDMEQFLRTEIIKVGLGSHL